MLSSSIAMTFYFGDMCLGATLCARDQHGRIRHVEIIDVLVKVRFAERTLSDQWFLPSKLWKPNLQNFVAFVNGQRWEEALDASDQSSKAKMQITGTHFLNQVCRCWLCTG